MRLVVYSFAKTHAVFLMDYDPAKDTFYCMDPASDATSGKITLAKSTLTKNMSKKTQDAALSLLDCYWYVSSSAYKIGEYKVANDGKGGYLYSSASTYSTKQAKVPDKTMLKITAVAGKYGRPSTAERPAGSRCPPAIIPRRAISSSI